MAWTKTIKGTWFIPEEWDAPQGFVIPKDRRIGVEFPGHTGGFPDTASGANVGQAVVFATMRIPDTEETYQTVVIWDRVPDDWRLAEGEGGRRIRDEFVIFGVGESDPLMGAKHAAEDAQKARDAALEAKKAEAATVSPAPVAIVGDLGWKSPPVEAAEEKASDEPEPVVEGDAPADE